MKKLLYIVIAVILLGILGYLAFNLLQKPRGQTQEIESGLLPAASLPAASYSITDQLPKTLTIKIGTNQGVVEMKNFYNALIDTEEGSVILADTDDYKIAYERDNGSFLIGMRSNSAVARQNAEAAFLQILGIEQTDACKLNVRVTFPPPDGENSRLSFCFGNVE